MSKLYVAMYHYTRDLKYSRYPEIKGLDIRLFEEQIEFMKKNFNIVTMEQVIECWNSPYASLPENALLLTFDDGYIDNYVGAFPILKKHGVQGSFFIPGKTFYENVLLDVNKIHFALASANIEELVKDVFYELDKQREKHPELEGNEELFEKYAVANRFDCKETIFVKRILQTAIDEKIRNEISSNLFKKYVGLPEDVFARELYMNRNQIKVMRDEGMFIGLHGYDHYWMANLTEMELISDIDKSLEVMSDFIEKDKWVLNYPYGSYNETVIKNISSRGCALGMTTNVAVADSEVDSRYEIPRLDCNDFPPKSNNYLTK